MSDSETHSTVADIKKGLKKKFTVNKTMAEVETKVVEVEAIVDMTKDDIITYYPSMSNKWLEDHLAQYSKSYQQYSEYNELKSKKKQWTNV